MMQLELKLESKTETAKEYLRALKMSLSEEASRDLKTKREYHTHYDSLQENEDIKKGEWQ